MHSHRIQILNFDKLTISVIGLCASLFPLFFLTLRGWTNACLFLAALTSIIYVLIRHPHFYKNKNNTYWLLLSALCAPFITELAAQILRRHIHGSSLDGPARFLLASFVYIAIVEMPDACIKLNFQWIIPTSLIICLLAYFLNPEASQFWGGRAASYFADPITFASYITALSFVCLLYIKKDQDFLANVYILGAFIFSMYLIILSQSRSAWTSGLVTALLVIFIQKNRPKKEFFIYLLLIIGFFAATYYLNNSLKNRIDLIFSDVIQYSHGYRDTSNGIRLSLARLDLYLFKTHLLTGIQDGVLPSFTELSNKQDYVTQVLYSMKISAGSHNEVLAQLSRKGLWGIASIFGLFLIPMAFFLKNIVTPNETTSTLAKVGFVFCTSIFISSLTIQVFNLKYTSSFYALMLAVLTALITKKNHGQT